MAPAGEIVGRTAEVAAVEAFLAGPAPAALVLEGEAGSGKTTVWEHALRADGHRLLVARPTGAESRLSLSTIADVLGGVAPGELAALPRPQRRALGAALLLDEPADDAPQDPRALAVGFLTAIRQLATASPVLIAVDDVQWAD